jgi:hypothetical protein
MNHRIIDRPVFKNRESYDRNIEMVVKDLSSHSAVKSIYRMGNITDPGISDVDMLVVLNDGLTLPQNPRSALDADGHYLFTHALFAIPESLIEPAMNYSLYHNFDHLWGEKNILIQPNRSIDSVVKNQIALEYILKLFISITIQRHIGIIKMRSFLLEAKALKFDLEILKHASKELSNLVMRISEIRSEWFKINLPDADFIILFEGFYTQLKHYLDELSFSNSLFSNKIEEVAIGKNILLKNNSSLKIKINHTYPKFHLNCLPESLLRKYLGLTNRLTKYEFTFPLAHVPKESELEKKLHYEISALTYLSKFAPSFIAMKSPLKLI